MVTITRGDNVFLLQPAPPGLESQLRYHRRKVIPEVFPRRFEYIKRLLYSPLKDNSGVVIYDGLFSRTSDWLHNNGHRVDVVDHRSPLPDADLSRVQGPMRPGQPEAFASIVSSRRGLINGVTGFGKTWVICQLTRVYADTKILVVSPEKGTTDEMYDRIVEANPEAKVSLCYSGKRYLPESDVIVVTVGSLHRIDPEWPGLFLFDEVHTAGQGRLEEILPLFQSCRMFGFSATPRGRSDGSDRMVEAFFGKDIFVKNYEDAESEGSVSPIDVFMVKVKAPEFVPKSDFGRDRYGYWRHQIRNEVIAQIARHHAADPMLIICKSVEHIMYLRMLLPDYYPVHSGISAARWEELVKMNVVRAEDYEALGVVDVAHMKECFKSGGVTKIMATGIWKQAVDFPHLAHMIRADGQTNIIPSLQMGGRLSRPTEGTPRSRLYDLRDDYGEVFMRRSTTRASHYINNGWTVRDIDITEIDSL